MLTYHDLVTSAVKRKIAKFGLMAELQEAKQIMNEFVTAVLLDKPNVRLSSLNGVIF